MFENLRNQFTGIIKFFSGNKKLTEKNIQESVEKIKDALISADVNIRVVRRFINSVVEKAKGTETLASANPGQQFTKIMNDCIIEQLGSDSTDIDLKGNPAIILLMGNQGSGKTTTVAKLAGRYKDMHRSVAMLGIDTQRPAALQQLKSLGKELDIPVYPHTETPFSNASAALKQGLYEAKKDSKELIILDSAGRTETDQALLDELKEIHAQTKAHARILVIDSMIGQSAVDLARQFDGVVPLTGLILTKADSDAKGGALLSIKSMLDIPVHFLGTGEKLEDFEVFHPERIGAQILGMGDVVSLVEKVQQKVDEVQAKKLEKKIISERFTLEDYLEQFQQLQDMGSIEKIKEYLPTDMQYQAKEIDEKKIRSEEAIILSMTYGERMNHKIIGSSRRARIARGSGTSVAQVHRLIKNFEKTKLTMKKMLKNKRKFGIDTATLSDGPMPQ